MRQPALSRLVCQRRSLAAALLSLSLVACGGPPINQYDPPPTFAWKLVAGDPRLQAQHVGAYLDWLYGFEIAMNPGGFVPMGSEARIGNFSTFGKWYVASNRKWPARWRVTSEYGCGAGTSANISITAALVTLGCYPRTTPIVPIPSSYNGGSPPSALTLQFDRNVVPPGLPITVWIVDANSGTIVTGPDDRTTDGNSQVQIPAPWLYDGTYQILADSPYAEPRIDGATGEFRVVNNPASSSAQIAFFEHVDFVGGSVGASGEIAFVGWDWNDRISSLRIPPGHSVILYEHENFQGASLQLTGYQSDLRVYPGPGPDGNWNDVVSSVRIY